MLRLTLTQMRSAAPRLVAAGLAILLGTAFVTATLLASSVMERTTYNAVTAQYADADLVVSGGMTTKTLEQIRDLDGVAAADAMAQTGVELSNGSRSEFTVADATASDPSLEHSDVADGSLPSSTDGVAVSEGTAQRLGVGLGDEITLTAEYWPADGDPQTKEFSLQVTGMLQDTAMQLYMPTGAVLSPQLFTQVQDFISPDTADQVPESIVAVADGNQVAAVKSQVQEVLTQAGATGATVQTTTEVAEQTTAQIAGNQLVMLAMLLAFAAVSLIVAALVIANTFQVLVAQRTRTLALLRCVGALKGQVRSSVLIEAAFLGVIASAAGVLVGTGLVAAGLSYLAHNQPDVPVATDLVLTPQAVIIPMLTGIVVTVAAALLPARLATRVAPLAALRPAEAPRAARASKARITIAALAFLGGVTLLLGGLALSSNSGTDGTGMILGLGVGILGGLASLFGILLACVLIVPGLIRLIGRLLSRSVPGRVAVANSTRNPRRSAATASALVIGVTLVTMMSTGAVTAGRALGNELDTSFPVDLSVSAPGPLQQPQIDAVTSTDGVQEYALLATTQVTAETDAPEGPTLQVAAAEQGDLSDVVRSPEVLTDLSEQSIVVPENFAVRLGLSEGQELTWQAEGGEPVDLTVQLSSLDGQTAVVTPQVLQQLDPDAQVTQLWAHVSDSDAYGTVQNVQSGLTEASEATPEASTPQLTGAAVERASYQNVVDTSLTVVIALLAVSVIIALIGVANTLSLSVMERRRESAMLRALGLTRGQLRGMLAIEGVMIAGAGAVIGILAGLAYGWIGSSILLTSMVDVPLVVPWQHIALVAAVALASGLLASVLPARSAVRTPPAAALAVD